MGHHITRGRRRRQPAHFGASLRAPPGFGDGVSFLAPPTRHRLDELTAPVTLPILCRFPARGRGRHCRLRRDEESDDGARSRRKNARELARAAAATTIARARSTISLYPSTQENSVDYTCNADLCAVGCRRRSWGRLLALRR